MNELIELNKYPVKEVIPLLLKDKTTGKNIVFATDTYSKYEFNENDEITVGALFGFESCDIQPRVFKDQSEQTDRTRKKAEVFSPTWICNKMNNHCDSDWFGREEVFNASEGQMWNTVDEKIVFSDKKDWKKYVDSRRLEITCGEAPYIVSRYDATTGESIDTKDRIGFLDRKLRVVSENTETEEEWIEWAIRAVQSVYGYEFQGDNLLIARINILISFCDYLKEKWGHEAKTDVLKKIANIISWNFWQMDGLTNSIPEFEEEEQFVQMALFDIGTEPEVSEGKQPCKIQNWRREAPLLFNDIQSKKRGKIMKFDYVIGNPPYQEVTDSESTRMPPIYDKFMDEVYKVADKVILITPARFLFNAGQTPKAWNQKMLDDTHLKVLFYEQEAVKIFPKTDIKGGVAITYHNKNEEYEPIRIFVPSPELGSILKKAGASKISDSLTYIADSSNVYNLSGIYADHPDYTKYIGDGGRHSQLKTNVLNINPIFTDNPTEENDYSVYGLVDGKRGKKYCHRRYLKSDHKSLDKYKVLVPKAVGSGQISDTFPEMIIAKPNEAFTQTYISIGMFNKETEAINLLKYIKSKFCRTLLYVLKVTQDNLPAVWSCIPLQNFTSSSDIDWSKSIAEIDQQLYRKYGLSDEEIEFIETHVKEMN